MKGFTKMKFEINKNTLAAMCWGVSIAAYMFQCYWRKAAGLIVPALIVFLLLEVINLRFSLHREWTKVYIVFVLYLSVSFAISALNGTEIGSALRFYLILLAIPVALCIKEPEFEKEWIILKILAVVKSGTVLLIWLDVFVKQDYWKYRNWARATGAGDIYIIHGIPRVQILGTSIFVMLFICEFLKKGKLTAFGTLMIATALAAGNSAYVLGLSVFAAFYYLPTFMKLVIERNWKLLLVVPTVLIILVAFGYYAFDAMKVKAEYSNAVRVEQIRVLTDTNPLLGDGLGHRVRGGGRWRTYDGDTYFELQTLYIYNQIGLIGLAIFYILTIVPYIKKGHRLKLIAYLTYLVYTFFNPYCFDSTHIISVILITNCIPENRIKVHGRERGNIYNG